jgi:siroheme synthase
MNNLKKQAMLIEIAKAKAKKAKKAKSEAAEITVFLHHGDKVVNAQTGEEYTISEWQEEKDNSEKERKSND